MAAVGSAGKLRIRRTWPQRLLIIASLGLIGSALAASWFVRNLYVGVAEIGRIQFTGDLLLTETDPTEPVNFLVIGVDSALGIDPDDPVHHDRRYDDRGTHNADSISLIRFDPVARQVWLLSIPRDLEVADPKTGQRRKINSMSLVGGAPLLVEAISETFDVSINHYLQLDFLAFREVVDKIGGVPLCFDHPARDPSSGLDIPVAKCTLMSGADALSYVRSRRYQEFIDGSWVTVGNSDFGRIDRQQEFVVLAIERAIARGARNPSTLSALISAGAESVTLDQNLTPSYLLSLASPFTEFSTDTLSRYSLNVYDAVSDRGAFVLRLGEGNDETVDIFRGVFDGVSLSDIGFTVAGTDPAIVDRDSELLSSLGFDVIDQSVVVHATRANVVIYPPSRREEAAVVARYLLPVPALVVDSQALEMMVVLGLEHEAVSYSYPQDKGETDAAIAAHGDVSVPELVPVTTAP